MKINQVYDFLPVFELHVSNSDALHLTIPPQGLPNGEASLPHAAYPGMPPYPGVGEYTHPIIIVPQKKLEVILKISVY